MSSLPSVTIQTTQSSNTSYPYSYPYSYPFIHPINTYISPTALTPSTIFPVPLVSSFYNPLIPTITTYPDINSDSKLRREITEYFFEKLTNNWIKYHYLDLYKMLVVTGDKVTLIKNIDQMESNKSDPKENNLKYEFILINYFAKNDVYKLLCKFRKLHNKNWWDIKHMSDKVRHFIHHKVRKYIKKEIINST